MTYFIYKIVLSTLTTHKMGSIELNNKIVENTHSEVKNLDHVAGSRQEILFDGYFYDVTDFIKRHPGGSIITYYTQSGEDGTHAIEQFHYRSKVKVKVMMSSLKKRPAPVSESKKL